MFEHCILERYGKFFTTSDNQFGFKTKSGCAHAIYSLRGVIDYYLSHGSTVNICALDHSKAFDKMNHHGLFVKLMQRRLPEEILCVLEYWFAIGSTCVKWYSCFSCAFYLPCGVRQGGVLSPGASEPGGVHRGHVPPLATKGGHHMYLYPPHYSHEVNRLF